MASASGARANKARQRRPAAGAPRPGSSPLHLDRDWTSLKFGPAWLIGERVLSNDVADYIRFRAVCTAWRACSVDPRAQGLADRRFHPRRWIMLPITSFNGRRRFLNVSTGQHIHLRIPDLHRHHLLGPTAEGLLVLCRKSTHVVQLLNPLTAQVADLPSAATLFDDDPPQQPAGATSRISFRCAGIAADSTVAIAVGRSTRTLAVAKPGGDRWTRLHLEDWIMAAFQLGGRLYCATLKNILVLETAASEQPPRLAVVAGYELGGGSCHLFHRMFPVHDDDGALMLIHRHSTGDSQRYTAYRAKLDTGNVVLVPTSGLGGQALFVCYGHSCQSVSARVSSSIRTDTIYNCNHGSTDDPVVGFDPLGRRSKLSISNKDIVPSCLFRYVCSKFRDMM